MTVTFDLVDDRLVVEAGSGAREAFALESMSVTAFHDRLKNAIKAEGGRFAIHGAPNEVPDPVPFIEDRAGRPWDAEAVRRYRGALSRIVPVFDRFRTSFLGKVSPVHLFWGSFDLAVTRFSGRRAPLHPGGILHLPDAVTQEAYDHEVSSAGFWPGNGGAGEAMFYSYAYPVPNDFAAQEIGPAGAYWDGSLGEFLLPYKAARRSDDPAVALMTFLQSTYAAAARTGDWDHEALECDVQVPGVPRPVRPRPRIDRRRRMIRGVDHVGLTVPDLDEAIAFHAAAFDCREVHWIGSFEATDDWMIRYLGVDRRARIPSVAMLALGDGARLELFAYETTD